MTPIKKTLADLITKIEQLKAELQQSATNCNKLKCLALLYKREMYFAKADKEYKMFCDNQSPLHEINNSHYEVADYEYRKAKKALKEGK